MVLVDTSSWTHALRRKGDPVISGRVRQLILDDRAGWCDTIRLELWNGARDDADRKTLRRLEAEINLLQTTREVWDLACDVGSFARRKGLNVPSTDLIIFACARIHGAMIEHHDAHFTKLNELFGAGRVPDRNIG